jgi:quercetin dioxygenase-like cupin family protein
MDRWNLMALPPSTEKRTPREPGADAPRVPTSGGVSARVLFSFPECRAVVVELELGQELGDHRVRERALVYVVSGRVSVEASRSLVECDAGTVVTFEPSESHTLRALTAARLLLVLTPWPATGHYDDAEAERAQHLPPNALVEPLAPGDPS